MRNHAQRHVSYAARTGPPPIAAAAVTHVRRSDEVNTEVGWCWIVRATVALRDESLFAQKHAASQPVELSSGSSGVTWSDWSWPREDVFDDTNRYSVLVLPDDAWAAWRLITHLKGQKMTININYCVQKYPQTGLISIYYVIASLFLIINLIYQLLIMAAFNRRLIFSCANIIKMKQNNFVLNEGRSNKFELPLAGPITMSEGGACSSLFLVWVKNWHQ